MHCQCVLLINMEDMDNLYDVQKTHLLKLITDSTMACIKCSLELKNNDRVILTKRNKKIIDGDFSVIVPQMLKIREKGLPHQDIHAHENVHVHCDEKPGNDKGAYLVVYMELLLIT